MSERQGRFTRRIKKNLEERGTVWTLTRFNLVKLGHCETKWLREIFAEFFGIRERDIPRRNKFTKRARDKSGDPMLISRRHAKQKSHKIIERCFMGREPFVDIKEAGKFLGIIKGYLKNYISEAKAGIRNFPYYQDGPNKKLLFKLSEFELWRFDNQKSKGRNLKAV
ncbi:MAG: hypothetical protein HND49_10280 [Planctomycetes bacterium]|nr:hypothetical protein [Planctomycetota bacterium]